MDIAIVGVDGLDPELVSEWRADLPTLDRLIDSGGVGRLRSSDPPLTCPAWPTLFTGKQGGKHGVFGFTRRTEGSYERTPVDYDDIRAESLWEALDTVGISCGVINVPLTYPPADLDHGVVVSGWPVPNNATVDSLEGVVSELEERLGEAYRVNPFPLTFEFDELGDQQLFEEIREGLWHHERAFEALLETRELDVFFGVFMAIDIASHNFASNRDLLKDMYVEQDRALESLLSIIPDGTDLVLLSDHGHGAQATISFHVNQWLESEGYLTREGSSKKGLLQRVGLTQSNYVKLKNALGVGNVHDQLPEPILQRLKRIVPRSSDERQRGFDPGVVDWSETVAYSGEQNELFLNTASHPEGIVEPSTETDYRDELAAAFESLPHPEEDRPLMSAVRTKHDLFDGPYVDRAPDLVFVADEMRCNAPMGFTDGDVFMAADWGEHRQYGTLLTAGPSFSSVDDAPDADIKDVLPLVLSLLGEPAPDDIDGSVPEERLKGDGALELRPSRDGDRTAASGDSDASDDVMEQLEGLGYLE